MGVIAKVIYTFGGMWSGTSLSVRLFGKMLGGECNIEQESQACTTSSVVLVNTCSFLLGQNTAHCDWKIPLLVRFSPSDFRQNVMHRSIGVLRWHIYVTRFWKVPRLTAHPLMSCQAVPEGSAPYYAYIFEEW